VEADAALQEIFYLATISPKRAGGGEVVQKNRTFKKKGRNISINANKSEYAHFSISL
jgi:hypothetical protein